MDLPLWVILDLINEEQPYQEAQISLELPETYQKQVEKEKGVEPIRVIEIEL